MYVYRRFGKTWRVNLREGIWYVTAHPLVDVYRRMIVYREK
jgi:hypothetical protein